MLTLIDEQIVSVHVKCIAFIHLCNNSESNDLKYKNGEREKKAPTVYPIILIPITTTFIIPGYINVSVKSDIFLVIDHHHQYPENC